MHRPNRDNSANEPRPIKQLTQGIIKAGVAGAAGVGAVIEETRRNREQRIEDEVNRRVAQERAVDSTVNSLGRVLDDIARENERKRFEAQRAKIAAEKTQLEMQRRELEQKRKEQQQRELLLAANEYFSRNNYKDACVKYLMLNNPSAEVHTNLEICYKKLSQESSGMVAEIEQLIQNGSEESLSEARDIFEEVKSIYKLIPVSRQEKSITLLVIVDKLKFASQKLEWEKKRSELKQETEDLLTQPCAETSYQDVIIKIETLISKYNAVDSKLFYREDRDVLAGLQEALKKYKALLAAYLNKSANQKTCKKIEQCLANLATYVAQNKLILAKEALDTATMHSRGLFAEAEGITEQQRIYLNPYYFTTMSDVLDPQVGQFEERRREFLQQNIAGQIIDGAIERFNQTNKTAYQSKDLYQRHFNRLKRKIEDQVLQEWHKFDQRAFPESFVATLTDKIAIEIKVIGWGKLTGSLWRSEGWKYISISSIGGGGVYGCGLLEHLEQAIKSFTPSEPAPNKVFLQGISIPVAEAVGTGVEVAAPSEPSLWTKLLLQGV